MNLRIFDIVSKFFRGIDEEGLMRDAIEVQPGPRGRKIYYLSTDEVERTRSGYRITKGFTSKRTGNIFLRPAGWDEATLRHETFHSLLVPRSRLGRFAKMPLYGPINTYLEEALAESYALRSLRRGLRFPLKNDYVSPVSLASDLALKGNQVYQVYYLFEKLSDKDDS